MAGATMPPEIFNPELADACPRARPGKSWLTRLTGRWLE